MCPKYPIEVRDLTFAYADKPILNQVSTQFERGKLTSIIGPNGSGKTTFIKHLSKILEPDHGSIVLLSKELKNYAHKELSKVVASVPQATAIEFDYTVEDVVMMGRYPHLKRFQTESDRDRAIVHDALRATDVYAFKDQPINTLSGGEIQRAIIARALAQEPDILILDEPISHLDIHHQIELLRLVRRLTAEKSLTVIMILHDLNFAIDFSDHVMMLKEGAIYAEGPPVDVITPESIQEVYNIEICIIENPVTGNPHVIPLGNPKE